MGNNDLIKNATFTSVWDGGYEVTTNCKVNMDTNEIFDIEKEEDCEELEVLDREYVTIDGKNYSCGRVVGVVFGKDDAIPEFWYE